MKTNPTKAQYEYALKRIEELLPITPDTLAANDPLMLELSLLSAVVEEYELEHYPIEAPSVAAVILSALSERGMTQRQLAEAIGVSPSRISDYVAGRGEPSLKQARLICRCLDISPAAMLGL